MYDNYHYPLGADTHDAPWNVSEPEVMDFDVCVYANMVKHTRVSTSDYCPEYYMDEDGGGCTYDTSDTDWETAYKENEKTIPELMQVLVGLAEKELDGLKEDRSRAAAHRRWELNDIIRSAKGWEVEELVVEED